MLSKQAHNGLQCALGTITMSAFKVYDSRRPTVHHKKEFEDTFEGPQVNFAKVHLPFFHWCGQVQRKMLRLATWLNISTFMQRLINTAGTRDIGNLTLQEILDSLCSGCTVISLPYTLAQRP